MLIFILIVAVMLGLIPAFIADSKGHDFFTWWIYGSALFIVAFIHSLFLKSPEEEAILKYQKQLMEEAASGKTGASTTSKRAAKKAEISANATPESLIKRAFIFIEDRDWDSAYAYCEAALDADPEMTEAYLGKLMAEYEVSEKSEFVNCTIPFDKNDNYKKILRFGNKELIDELNGYIEQINERNRRNWVEAARKAEDKRIEADRIVDETKNKKIEKIASIATTIICVVSVLALIIWTFVISHN